MLANLVSIGQVAVTYQADIEQLLVLLPAGTADLDATTVANRNTKQDDYKGWYLSFNLNLNLPPPCTTGYLPASQIRAPSLVDSPDRPADDLYCRIPQDSMFNVRGARNIPCETKPWKRAPTVKICESDENYVPLNDGLSTIEQLRHQRKLHLGAQLAAKIIDPDADSSVYLPRRRTRHLEPTRPADALGVAALGA